MSRNPWFMAGIIAGAMGGAALGLLYAPSSGRETIEALKAHFRAARAEAREAGMRAEADILARYQQVKSTSLATQPGAPSLTPRVP
jgi:gas vesicle protein